MSCFPEFGFCPYTVFLSHHVALTSHSELPKLKCINQLSAVEPVTQQLQFEQVTCACKKYIYTYAYIHICKYCA